jgi:tetratricopeptide (TPR) repeat protein
MLMTDTTFPDFEMAVQLLEIAQQGGVYAEDAKFFYSVLKQYKDEEHFMGDVIEMFLPHQRDGRANFFLRIWADLDRDLNPFGTRQTFEEPESDTPSYLVSIDGVVDTLLDSGISCHALRHENWSNGNNGPMTGWRIPNFPILVNHDDLGRFYRCGQHVFGDPSQHMMEKQVLLNQVYGYDVVKHLFLTDRRREHFMLWRNTVLKDRQVPAWMCFPYTADAYDMKRSKDCSQRAALSFLCVAKVAKLPRRVARIIANLVYHSQDEEIWLKKPSWLIRMEGDRLKRLRSKEYQEECFHLTVETSISFSTNSFFVGDHSLQFTRHFEVHKYAGDHPGLTEFKEAHDEFQGAAFQRDTEAVKEFMNRLQEASDLGLNYATASLIWFRFQRKKISYLEMREQLQAAGGYGLVILGTFTLGMNEKDLALSYYEQAGPHFAQSYDNQAYCHFKAGNWKQALNYFGKSVHHNGSSLSIGCALIEKIIFMPDSHLRNELLFGLGQQVYRHFYFTRFEDGAPFSRNFNINSVMLLQICLELFVSVSNEMEKRVVTFLLSAKRSFGHDLATMVGKQMWQTRDQWSREFDGKNAFYEMHERDKVS